MKKNITIISIIIFLFSISLTFAQIQEENDQIWTADVLPLCEGVCLEGNEAVWLIQLNNLGNSPIRFSEIYLIDDEDILFGYIDLTQEEAVVPPQQSGTVYVEGIIPPPSRASTLFYKLNYVVENEIYPDMMFRRMNVMKQSEIECTSNDFCDRNEVCAGYRCMPYSIFNQSEVPKPSNPISSDSIQIILLSLVTIFLMIITYFNINLSKKKK